MPKLTLTLALSGALAVLSAATAAPVKITFWHSMEGSVGIVERFAAEFNKSQNQYQVVPQVVGNYREAEAKLEAAIKAGTAPVMFQAELSYFPKLVADGKLANLEKFENTLGAEFRQDFYPAVWAYGDYDGKRFGLPWNVSTPALFFNAGTLRRAGLGAPKTWAELEATAKKLSTRGKRGFLVVADSWTFEQVVAAHGGNVVKDGQPNFTSPEVVEALELLARMVRNNAAVARTLDEAPRAVFDFVRGQNVIAAASVANWPDFQKVAVLFELGAAPMPCADKCAVPFGGAELVVLNGASAQEQAGAFAFWRYLMEPRNLEAWVQGTFYMTPRRSVQTLLQDFYKQNPHRAAVFAQLERAVPRPRVARYDAWRALLEEAITRATRDGVPARDALAEAQRKALAVK